jgi:hypothetical protein
MQLAGEVLPKFEQVTSLALDNHKSSEDKPIGVLHSLRHLLLLCLSKLIFRLSDFSLGLLRRLLDGCLLEQDFLKDIGVRF